MDGPVVVGTDGSDTATVAVREALDLAKAFGQSLHIVCAFHAGGMTTGGAGGEFAGSINRLDVVDSVLQDVASRARIAGVPVETHARKGDPADAIIEVATDVGAALIVIGNKGIGSMKRFVLGNVPSKVVHNAPCSTYVVHTT